MLTAVYLYLCHSVHAWRDEPFVALIGVPIFMAGDWLCYARYFF